MTMEIRNLTSNSPASSNLIDALVADLVPVRLVSPKQAMLLALGTTVAILLIVAMSAGLRPDLMAGSPGAILLLRSGALLVLGTAALTTMAATARPGVGEARHGWRWALAGACLFPLATLILSLVERELPMAEITSPLAIWCMTISLSSALVIGGLLTAWLRKGAPVALERAGWLVGLTAGAFGTFAYSLHCPSESFQYVGIWYSLAVGVSAVAGRLAVPPLLRW